MVKIKSISDSYVWMRPEKQKIISDLKELSKNITTD